MKIYNFLFRQKWTAALKEQQHVIICIDMVLTNCILRNYKRKLEKVIIFYIKKICELVDNCRVTTHNKYFIIEIDIEGNNLLAEDTCKKLLRKRICARKLEEKIGHGYKIGNLLVHFQYLNKGMVL